jgi:hypothetical protein
LFFALIMCICGTELEAELLGIWDVADATTGYVHAHGVNQEECLLVIPNHVQDTMELGIHRGAAVA